VHGLSQAIQKRGLPRALMTDKGAAMVADEVREGLARLGIVHERTLPYSPYQNGKQEAFWGTLEGQLMAMLDGQTELSLEFLNEATQAGGGAGGVPAQVDDVGLRIQAAKRGRCGRHPRMSHRSEKPAKLACVPSETIQSIRGSRCKTRMVEFSARFFGLSSALVARNAKRHRAGMRISRVTAWLREGRRQRFLLDSNDFERFGPILQRFPAL
jgi:transposase InsO family protein